MSEEQFSYVVDIFYKNPICFGSTKQKTNLPSNCIVTRSLPLKRKNEYETKFGLGVYPISDKHKIQYIKTTDLRTSSFKSRSSRFCRNSKPLTDTFYNISQTKCAKINKIPFNTNEKRFKETKFEHGVFHNTELNRRSLPWDHSFGGKKCLKSFSKVKCPPVIDIICGICHSRSKNEFWMWQKKLLCNLCMESERRSPKHFSLFKLSLFKLTQNCSAFHHHFTMDNVMIKKLTCSDLKKIILMQNYFYLYR